MLSFLPRERSIRGELSIENIQMQKIRNLRNPIDLRQNVRMIRIQNAGMYPNHAIHVQILFPLTHNTKKHRIRVVKMCPQSHIAPAYRAIPKICMQIRRDIYRFHLRMPL